MNCFNSSEYLDEAIQSVYAQTYKNFEIIFIDNQSTDGSDLIAKKYDSRLKYFRTPEFMNLYGARSYGLQFVTGDYLAFLDCDDLWMPEKLEHQLGIFNEKKAGFVYGGFKLKFEVHSLKSRLKTSAILALNFIRRMIKGSSRHAVDKIIRNYDINLQTAIFDCRMLNGATFNPRLNLLGDLDFFFRLGIKNDMVFYYDRKVVAKYRIHEKQLSKMNARDWVREGRYCSIFLYKDLFSEKNMEQFRMHVDFFRGNSYWEMGAREKALSIKSRLRFRNSTTFLDWLRCSIKNLLS